MFCRVSTMGLIRWRSFITMGIVLALQDFAAASVLRVQVQAPMNEPQSAPKGAFNSELAEARRLSQHGKFDEAIAKLEALALKDPELKGLAHELGVTYYKKSDYLKAVASFKKALEDDPADNEAVQLMGLSYYLA